MSFITNTGLRSLSYATFAVPEDGAVFKKIPGLNEDGSTGGIEKQVTARVDDTLRMSRLLVGDFRKKDDLVVTDPQTKAVIDVVERNRGTNSRTQAGNKFLANLALINQQATLAKIQKKEFTGLGSTVLDGAKDIAKTVASTLAQVPVAGTGVHFVNGGKVGKEYLEGGGNAVGNFLRNLTGVGGNIQGHERAILGKTIIDDNRPDSDSYVAGENADLVPTSLKNRYFVDKLKDSVVEQKTTTFIDKLSEESKRVVKTKLRYQGDPNIEKRKNLVSVDQINSSDILQTPFFNERDIIPFEFQILDPEKGGKPDYIYFRAYLDSFDDNFTSGWNTTKYIGRAENLYNYTGFDRSIGFSFKIAAHTREELVPIYKKLNLLAGTTAPSYSETSSFMRGIYTKLSIGDYLVSVPGFFENISINWDKLYPWEIGVNLFEHNLPVPRVPHILDINMNFKPVHNFNPAFGRSFIATQELTRIFNPGLESAQNEIKPELIGNTTIPQADIANAEVDLTFAESPVKKSTQIQTVNLNSLNNVPQRTLTSVPTTPSPSQPSLGSNTVIPYKAPLESNPFGG